MLKAKKRWFNFIVKHKAARVRQYLEEFICDFERLLDVGCGDMIVTQHFQDSFPRKMIVGLDTIDINQSSLPIVLYNGKKIPFQDNSFDVVYAIFSLHHCADELQILKEMKRVTSNKIIVIEEVYKNWFDKYYLFVHDWIGNRIESPLIDIPFNFHTDEEWKKYFNNLGLKIDHQQDISQFAWFCKAPLFDFTHQKLYVLSKH